VYIGVGLLSGDQNPVALMSEIQQPIIAPQDDGSGIVPEHEAPEPAPITEEEVGEYREQDRFLPVRLLSSPKEGSLHAITHLAARVHR
jgi:hypothetical protein